MSTMTAAPPAGAPEADGHPPLAASDRCDCGGATIFGSSCGNEEVGGARAFGRAVFASGAVLLFCGKHLATALEAGLRAQAVEVHDFRDQLTIRPGASA